MAKTVELLLVESVENLGIVGDVVKVRTGYARNFLLPRSLATVPSDDLIQSLQAKRIKAQHEVSELRSLKAQTIDRLKGYELLLERACNDQGILYAAVTQQEIAAALTAAGYMVRTRDVRLSGAIKRVDNYDIHIKYETELETHIKLHIKADRVLAKDEKPDLDFDNEGNLIEKRPGGRSRFAKGDDGDAAAKGDAKDGDKAAAAKGEKADKGDKDKPAKPAAPVATEEPAQKASKKPREDVKKPAKDAGKKA